MTPRTVQIWFQNKRQSEKAKETQAETETEGPRIDILASGAVGQQVGDQEEIEREEDEEEDEDQDESSHSISPHGQGHDHGQHYDAIRDVVSPKDKNKGRGVDTRKGKGKAAER